MPGVLRVALTMAVVVIVVMVVVVGVPTGVIVVVRGVRSVFRSHGRIVDRGR